MTRFTTQSRMFIRTMPVLGLGAALVLTGCSSSDDDADTSPTPAVEDTQTPEAEPTEAPEVDDTAGSDDPLQDYLDLELEQLDTLGESLGDMYSDIQVEAEPPSGMVYTYTFADELDPELADTALAGIAETLETLTQTSVFPMMEQTGVPAPQSATYTYLNPDGTELWSETFTSE